MDWVIDYQGYLIKDAKFDQWKCQLELLLDQIMISM